MAVDSGGKVPGATSHRMSGSEVLGFGVVMATSWQRFASYVYVDVRGRDGCPVLSMD